jgi:hypothetical protein
LLFVIGYSHSQLTIFKMIIKSIETEIDIKDALGELDRIIESTLQQWGEPLRWAITTVDIETNIARVEAIVIKE